MRPVCVGIVNVPRVDYDDSRVAGLRDHLADKCAELLARFVESDAEHFPYRGAEIRRLQSRLDDLHGNRDVLVYQHEIPAEWQPPRPRCSSTAASSAPAAPSTWSPPPCARSGSPLPPSPAAISADRRHDGRQSMAAASASPTAAPCALSHCTWASIPVSARPARTRLAIICSPRPRMYTGMLLASSAETGRTAA